MEKEVIIKAIGPQDAYFVNEPELVGLKMISEQLIHHVKEEDTGRIYNCHGSLVSTKEIVWPNGKVLPTGTSFYFFDVDIEEVL